MSKGANIIFVGNYKGGVGKTTSVLNFSEYFAKAGKRILAIDLDPQSSLSELLLKNGGFGNLKDLAEPETLNYVFDLYIQKIERYKSINLSFEDVMIKNYKGYSFIPSSLFYRDNMGLDALAMRMHDNIEYLSILKLFIDTIRDRFDYIFIDCPPSSNAMTQSAFLMSDYYIIPTILDGISSFGVAHYINAVSDTYNKYCGKKANEGILARHFFGEQPKLIGVFFNLIRGQVNYDEARKELEKTLEGFCDIKVPILEQKVNNYIDIARKTENGTTSIKREDYKILTEELLKLV